MPPDTAVKVPAIEGGVSSEPPSGLRPAFTFRPRTTINLRVHLAKSIVRLIALIALDLSAVAVGRIVLGWIRAGGLGGPAATMASSLFPVTPWGAVQLAVALVAALLIMGCYRSGDYWRDPARQLSAVALALVLVLYLEVWQGQPLTVLTRGLIVWVMMGLTIVAFRFLLDIVAHRVVGPFLGNHVLEIRALAETETHDLGSNYHILAVIPVDRVPEDVREMESWLSGGVNTLLIADEIPDHQFRRLTDFALTHGCNLLSACRPHERVGIDSRRTWIKGRPYFELTAPTLRASQLVVKRTLDVVGAGALLLALGIPMVLLGIAVRLESPGPALFRQRRTGYLGRFFLMTKFRSMRADAEEILRNDPALYERYLENDFKLPEEEDPRITRLGRFLRHTSLDELPQLLNVLKGDMSLVGPRPVEEAQLEMYRGRIPTLLSVKPGLTGLWQISGRSRIAFPERAGLDLEYVRSWSLLRDFWILIMTVPAVLLRRGAH